MARWIVVWLVLCPKGQAQNQDDLKIKANYINRFARNLVWPSYAIGHDFVVGIIGDASTVDEISSVLTNQQVKNKKIVVKHFTSINEIEQCPILYISSTSRLLISGVFQKVANKPILIITEKEGYATPGGSDINFVKPIDRWLYEIVPEQIDDKGISVALKILDEAYEKIKLAPPPPPPKTITKIEKTTEIKYVEDPKAKRKLNEYKQQLSEIREEQALRIKELGLKPEEEKELIERIRTLRDQVSQDSLITSKLLTEAKLAKEIVAREKLEKAKVEKEKEAAAANQRTQLTILTAIIIFLSSLAFMLYYYSQRRKKRIEEIRKARNELTEKITEINRQNDLLEESTRIMDQKNREIKDKNSALEEQNRKITDSIRYALTIQEAMLPEDGRFSSFFDEHFIIYRPKDIVSGDFYWLNRSEDKTLIAVVDCTGHGVPGAFMSTIGTDLLNEIVNEKHITDPSSVLEMLHQGVYKRLRQGETNNRDGMDVCFCTIQKAGEDHFDVTFAGAKRPFYYTENQTLKKFSGDSKYIGGIRQHIQAFTNHQVRLPKGSILYLTTDGYIDSPDPERKKFGSARFQDLLDQIQSYPLSEQKTLLLDTLKAHRQDTRSRDDITIVGIKL